MGVRRSAGRVMAAFLAFSLMATSAAAATGPTVPTGTAPEPDKKTEAERLPDEQAIVFSDLTNSYARESVNHLASLQLISGKKDNLFLPQEAISRQDVFVLLAKVMGVQPKLPREEKYEDVSMNSPYAPYIYGLTELGVLNGRSDGTLGAADPLTRQEMAVILDRLWKAGSGPKQILGKEAYDDEDEIADYAREAVASVTAQGWMKGANGAFRPQGQVTRGDAAVIAERVWNARYQLAEKVDFAVSKTKLTVMAGTSERVEVTRPSGGALPFTPVFAFDHPELGTILPDGTFVAGPSAGKGTLTVNVGFKQVTIPVEITNAPVEPKKDEAKGQDAKGTAEGKQAADAKESGNAAKKADADEKQAESKNGQASEKTGTPDSEKKEQASTTDTAASELAGDSQSQKAENGKKNEAVGSQPGSGQEASSKGSDSKAAGSEDTGSKETGSKETDSMDTGNKDTESKNAENNDNDSENTDSDVDQPSEEDELVNLAPGSFTSVKTFGMADAFFQEVEKQYPGPVGGLVTPSETWTGYNRQFGRKVTVVLPEAKQLERVTLTLKHQRTSGITIPEWMDVEVSPDGKAWYFAGKAKHDVSQAEDAVVERTLAVTLPQVETRYVRVSFPVKVFAFARQLEVWGRDGKGSAAPPVLLPFANQTDPQAVKPLPRRVENMLLAYTGEHGERGTWTKEEFLPMVGYRTTDGYMRDQMFDTILFLPYQTMPATKDRWKQYLDDLYRSNQQLDALNSAMREFNRLRGTLYASPTIENVVLALPYPNSAQTDFGVIDPKKGSLSFNAKQVGEEQAYQNRKQALEWYYGELKKRWDQAGFQYLRLDGIYWFHELVEDGAPKERDLIRHMGSMVHNDSLRYYWIPYFGAPGLSEWKSLYFDNAFLQPTYYTDKPVPLERIQGTVEVMQKYSMDVEIEGDDRMYRDPKFYQLYYNQLIAARKAGMDKNNIHAYYFGSKTLLIAANSDDPVIRAIYDDTYKWMRGKFEQDEYYLPEEIPVNK
ncbi:DUF4855 domain-containing protein [Brevibacillus borstelensis]|jgi:Domain of unknown function (DUF4855)/S-layer homology domain|uniref:DUF4855 domain-containing protein n=1 Tax=Brevibacillus borstelensis TaxID=45462 RepID=UPI00116CF13E|nr:DUF4855 domain-containing protein [Brevibacillus borstelensis]MED1881582.1 DUF4855 domain-containing protein [Brevibacillus borstelensis]GED52195.1 hypothetical protein BBO01nite_14360 [Brevibacillus borstelensis]